MGQVWVCLPVLGMGHGLVTCEGALVVSQQGDPEGWLVSLGGPGTWHDADRRVSRPEAIRSIEGRAT